VHDLVNFGLETFVFAGGGEEQGQHFGFVVNVGLLDSRPRAEILFKGWRSEEPGDTVLHLFGVHPPLSEM
jgi:hypothetical protein